MKIKLIVAAMAALALASCNEDETTRIESGNKHLEDAGADYGAAAKSAGARAMDAISASAAETSDYLGK